MTERVTSALRTWYEEIGELLQKGNAAFIAEGPGLLRSGMQSPDIAESVFAAAFHTQWNPEMGRYGRVAVIGDPGRHVLRALHWLPGSVAPPHEHGGSGGIEYVAHGQLVVLNWGVYEETPGQYALRHISTNIVRGGETAVVDPQITDVHSVTSTARTLAVHAYPRDAATTFRYAAVGGLYARQEVPLPDDTIR